MNNKILYMEDYLKEKLYNESTGHDYYHALRVAKLAMIISDTEGGDKEIIYVSSLVHDLIDHKLFTDPSSEIKVLISKLTTAGFSDNSILKIINIIENISFSKGKVANSLEGKIVQDADRLDAIGAIGIARTFAYGGSKNRMIYDENIENKLHSIQHFYDKLLKLKDLMNTKKSKQIAESRTEYLQEFLKHFFNEWNVNL